MAIQEVTFSDLGQMAYKQAWDYQEQLLQQAVAIKATLRNRADGVVEDGEPVSTRHYLLFVEHPPVYTLGKSGDISNVLLSEDEMSSRGIGFYKINRGGDITFHGPQQLVGYPIFDLEKFYTDIGRYLRNIEEVIIRRNTELNQAVRLVRPAYGWMRIKKDMSARSVQLVCAAAAGSPCMASH